MKRPVILILFSLASTLAIAAQEFNYAGLSHQQKQHNYRFGERGYFGKATIGVTTLFDSDGVCFDSQELHYKIDMIHGYSFNPYFDLGVGIGVYFKPDNHKIHRHLFVPIYIHGQVNFLDRRVCPYLAADIGGAATAGYKRYQSGTTHFQIDGADFYSSCEAGVAVRLKRGRAINVGVSTPIYPLNFHFGLNCNIGFVW